MANNTEIPLAKLIGPDRSIAIVDSLQIHGNRIAAKLDNLNVRSVQFLHLQDLEKDTTNAIAGIVCCMRQVNSVIDLARPYVSARKIHGPLVVMPTQTRMSAAIQRQILRTDGNDKSGIIIGLVPKLDSDRVIELLTQGLRQMTK